MPDRYTKAVVLPLTSSNSSLLLQAHPSLSPISQACIPWWSLPLIYQNTSFLDPDFPELCHLWELVPARSLWCRLWDLWSDNPRYPFHQSRSFLQRVIGFWVSSWSWWICLLLFYPQFLLSGLQWFWDLFVWGQDWGINDSEYCNFRREFIPFRLHPNLLLLLWFSRFCNILDSQSLLLFWWRQKLSQ